MRVTRISTRSAASGLVLLVVAVGCRSSDSPAESAAPAERIARTKSERGPLRVMVEVEPAPARLSDELTMTITFDYEHGVQLEKPPFGEAVGDFVIRDFREPLPQTKDDREIARQVYTLEPTHAGELGIDPILVVFTDNRLAGDRQQHQVETEALTVKVDSMVAAEAPSLDDLQGFSGPVPLPEPPSNVGWWVGIGAAGVVALVAISAAVGLLKRRKISAETTLSPRELAERELDRIWRDELFRRDVKRFYVELTGAVRRYIEATSGIRAPEQTTEEFLREITAGDRFPRDERARLQRFLESADLVKFAAQRPDAADIEEAYRRARAFVGIEQAEAVA